MRINTNVSAMMAANNLSKVQDAVSNSMEKLSSGFRINKAADDAAGLGIANTLRADGRALSQASRNADQTTSLLQVAEGGTSTIESILERMKELATQSGSDTVDAAGRASINAEFTALRSEIDRTVSTTTFQGSSLLDGTFGSTAPQLAATDITFAGGNANTAVAGAYTISVSNSGIATLHRANGGTDSVDLNPSAGLVTYNSGTGKASVTFGSGNSAITVAATASSASDVAGIQKSLDAHGFTVTAAVAATASTATTNIAGASGITMPSSQVSGSLHFHLTDASATPASGLTASSYVSAAVVPEDQEAGSYTLNVVSTDANVSGGTLGGSTGVSGLAVATNQAAGVYTIGISAQNATIGTNNVNAKLGGGTALAVASSTAAGSYKVTMSGDNLQIINTTTGKQVGTDLDVSAHDFSTNLAVSEGGITFTVAGGTYVDKAAFENSTTGFGVAGGLTFTVTGSASLTVKKAGVLQGSAVDVSGYDGSTDLTVNQGGVSFTVDHTADTSLSALTTALDTKTATVTGEVRTLSLMDPQSVIVGAAQDFHGILATNNNINFSQGGISFTIDKSITDANIVSNLDGKILTVAAPKIDLLDTDDNVLATQTLASYSAASDVAFSNNGYGITFAGSNGATNSYDALKGTLNDVTKTLTVVHVAQGAASAGTVTGNGSATTAASFMVDSSGQYKTNDMVQLQALDLTVATLGLTTLDLSTADSARNALSTIDSAMGTVSTALGSIGANQNRISYAQDNLKTKISNFSAAESVIRDVDMADEMTTFSKNNILAQAGTAMLAQANQSGQSVLKLLQ